MDLRTATVELNEHELWRLISMTADKCRVLAAADDFPEGREYKQMLDKLHRAYFEVTK